MDLVASPTSLYFSLDHKEANTRLIISQLAAIQLHQIKTTLQYVHIEGGKFSTNGGKGGKMRVW